MARPSTAQVTAGRTSPARPAPAAPRSRGGAGGRPGADGPRTFQQVRPRQPGVVGVEQAVVRDGTRARGPTSPSHWAFMATNAPPPQPAAGDQVGDEPVQAAVERAPRRGRRGRSWPPASAAGPRRRRPPRVRHRSPPSRPSAGSGRPRRTGRRSTTARGLGVGAHDHAVGGQRRRGSPHGLALADRHGRDPLSRSPPPTHRRGRHHAAEQRVGRLAGRRGRWPGRAPRRRAGAAGRSAA